MKQTFKKQTFNANIFEIIRVLSKRSTCLRRQISSVITKENNIISTGYNGAPSGCVHCVVVGCLRQKLNIPSGERMELCRAGHAEVNAIVQAAKHGISTNGASIYTQSIPCGYCAKAIINSGITDVYYLKDDYPDKLGIQLIEESGKVTLHQIVLKEKLKEDFEYRLP